jgi:hypothetical protein
MFVEKNKSLENQTSQYGPGTSSQNPNSKYLAQEEMNILKSLSSSSQNLIFKFGQNEYQKQILETYKQELLNEFENLRTEEEKFLQSIKNKYGTVNINTETGEITPLG